MKKLLNKRLQEISAFIEKEDKVIDIGCDHAFLAIYLKVCNGNNKVIASDINEKPLLKAQENILKYANGYDIKLRKGDGLSVLDNDIDTVVISGMGSINIVNILKNIKNYPSIKKLILSPNNDFSLLRKSILKLGFRIKREKLVFDKNKYYLISEFIKGKEKMNYFFGKLDLRDKTVINYYQDIYDKNRRILENLTIFQKLRKISLIKENYLIRKKIHFE